MPSLAVKDLRTGRKEVKIIGLMKTGTNANLLPTAIPPVLQLSKLIPDAAPERIALSTLADDKITKWTRDEIGRKEIFSKQDFHFNAPTVIKVSETPVTGGDGLGVLIDPKPKDPDSKVTVTDVAEDIKTTAVSGVETTLFGSATSLSMSLYNDSAKHLVIDHAGIIHLAFTDSHVDNILHIYHAYSSDGGKTFAVERVDTTSSYDQIYADLVIDSKGIIHFVYVQGGSTGAATGVKLQYRRKYTDGSWSAVTRIDEKDNQFKYEPVIQVKKDGITVGIAWVSLGYGSSTTNENLIYREVNSDLSLGTTQVITTDGSSTKEYRQPTLDYNIDGYPHIACFAKPDSGAASPRNVWYFSYNGSSWSSGVQVNDVVDYGCWHSNMVIDSKNRTHIVYSSGSTFTDLKYRRRVNGSWQSPVTLTLAGGGAINAIGNQLSVSSDGRVSVVYFRYSSGSDMCAEVIYIDPNGTTFGNPATLYNVAGYQARVPQLLWSRWPAVGSKDLSTPQQGNIMIMLQGVTGATSANLVFIGQKGSVFGDVPEPIEFNYTFHKNAGNISRTSICMKTIGKKNIGS